jgi:hypothetical protein
VAFSRFTLNTSQLNDETVGLDGPNFPLNGTGAAPLGASTASAVATVTKIASASSTLGELVAEVSEVTVTVDAEADATLGGLSASATANIDNPASGDASLGGLVSSAIGSVSVVATATGNLGSVIAIATGSVTPLGTMTANLGGLDATAIGTVTPQPTPPQPQTQGGGGGRLHPYRQSRPKQPAPQPVVEPEIVVVPVKTVQAYCTPIVASVSATASGSVTFVAEDDDLQVLLML